MIQALTVTTTAVPTKVSDLGNFPAIRGLKGVQIQAAAAGVFWGGKGSQPVAVPDAAISDVLPIVHLGDLWLRGAGTVTVVCFL